ncbi:MAG: c-type cytochrome [Armatimonadetes bacterium]|nr:c-type cytochrome [Armatimonadota bacterium]
MSSKFLIITIICIFLFQQRAYSQENGENIFLAKCSSCHTIGNGDLTGPDLKDLFKRREKKWIKEKIKYPERMAIFDAITKSLLEKYKNSMPDLGLEEKEIEALLIYLENPALKIEKTETPPLETRPILKGNPEKGRKFFTGELMFKNNSPACISCHNLQVKGFFQVKKLAEDLTDIYIRFGDDLLYSSLKSPPFYLMNKIYPAHPLTDEEIADLTAFFNEISNTVSTAKNKINEKASNFSLHLYSGILFIFILIIFQLIWRKRLPGR